MKKYEKAKELLETKANIKEKKPIYATRKLSIGLVSCMLGLVMATPVVNAEEANQNQPQQVQEENQTADNGAENPDTNHAPVPLENNETPKKGLGDLDTQSTDVLELGPEIVGVPVTAGIEAPTITKAFIGTNTISGGSLHRGKINGKNARGTVHVTLKDSSGNEKATVSVTPKSGTTWTVDLPEGVTIAEGDTVTAYQEFDGQNSTVATANAMDSLAKQNKDKLKMPTGEIWIEQTSSNIVNDEEQAEAVQKLKDANTAIAGDIKSVKFSIDTAEHAYYEVTYTDGSTSDKIEAPDLKIKQVTEYSRKADLEKITIVDNVIKGKLEGEGPFKDIKVQIILKISEGNKDNFCTDKGCKFDKTSSNPVDAVVDANTGEFSYTISGTEKIERNQVVGVTVKEKNKFVSCATKDVTIPLPEKTEVKDPRKLTADDKKAIDAAIRKAYTVNGVSKLPNGIGDWDGVPAVIQIDDSGNAKIFNGNDVAGTWDWDNGGIFVPEKNEDGSVKLKEGAQPKITIPAKDLVKNIKPEPPTLAKSGNNITITPNEKDTDANSISVSYTGKDGKGKTTTATKGENGWTIEGDGEVDANGVITLPKDKVKGNTDVTATVTDKGGIADDDKTPLTSEQGTLTVEETIADKVEALGGLDPVVMKKWVGDKLDWKDGVVASKNATDENKAKIKEFLDKAETKFTDETTPGRNTDAQGDYTGTIKVSFDDGSSIEVKDQKLYVSNHVTSMDRKDKVPTDALDVEFKLGEGTKVDNTGSGAIEGNKDNPTSYSNYKVKPNTNLKEYKIPAINASAVDSIKLSAQDGYTDPTWNTNNFVATSKNKVFTATATKTYKVTVVPNGGTGTKIKVTKKKDETYTLPAANTFTPPNDNQEFSGWKIGDDTNLKQPNESIKISGDTEIKAIWKPIEFKVTFKTEAGAEGSMNPETVTKGSEYKLPKPTFKAIEGKEFAGWKVGDSTELKPIGEKIEISGDVTLTAVWADKKEEVKVSFNHGDGATGNMEDKTVKKGETYTLPEHGFKPNAGKKFVGWKVPGETEVKKVGDTITVKGDTTLIALWEDEKAPDGGNINPGGQPDPNPQPQPKPGDKPSENEKTPDKEKPADPDKTNPEKPGDKEPGKEKDKNEEGKKPGVEDRLRIRYNPNGGHWNDNSTDIITYYYDRGNIITLINPPTREGYRFLYWKGSAYQPGDKYTVVDDHMFVAQWEKIGTKASRSNPKTGLESVAGIVCTLVGSTGALYISRKKED